jgi:catechol-2,3-dioxygenase
VTLAGICELVLETDEVEDLVRFYRELGLEPISAEGDRAWLAAGECCRLGIWPPGEKEHSDRGGRHVHFALSVDHDRLDEMSQGLRERGVEVDGPVEHDGGDRSVYLQDPEGNVVEVWDFFGRGQRVGDL